MGTGDGLYIYNCARTDTRKFFIGIDANRRPLQKISERIHRRPSKGGLPNVLFAQAAVEALPPELEGIAAEVQVNFPWGSLLGAVAKGDKSVLDNLRFICSDNALLKVIIGLDAEKDCSEIERLALPALNVDYVNSVLVALYKKAGFEITKAEEPIAVNPAEFQTSWAKRLRKNPSRSFISIVAQAVE
jgi:16S rRNA (adenine(1408)-N(1))-methyltransferase